MATRPRRTVVALVVALTLAGLVALAGCATDDPTATDPAGGGDGATTPSPGQPGGPIGPVEPDGAFPVTPTPGTADPRPAHLEGASASGTSLSLLWYQGVEPCTVLDHVAVVERPDRVEVTVLLGAARTSEPMACIQLARLTTTTVSLAAPLGERAVVDGASGAVVPTG